MFENLLKLAKLNATQMLKFTIGVIVVYLAGQNFALQKERKEHEARCEEKRERMQEKLDEKSEQTLLYLEKKEEAFMNLLKEYYRVNNSIE